jgi:hypothetical protein
VKLGPKIRTRERILTYGIEGTGKSRAILSLARYCPESTFYVFDTEVTKYDRLLDTEFTDVATVGNAEVMPVTRWDPFLEAVQKVADTMGRDDWLVIDPMTPTWTWVQSWFVDNVHGTSMQDFFLARRKAMEGQRQTDEEKKQGFQAIVGQDGDWQVINQQYFQLYGLILNCTGHVYMTAETDEVKTKGWADDSQTQSVYGAIGRKPKGQKRLGHIPSTVIYLTKTRVGEYQMTTVKDQGRTEMDREEVRDFAKDYFMRIANWRPVA